jgi:hypothetical protein
MFELVLSHKFVDHRVHRAKGIQINIHVVVDSMKYSIVRQKAGHVLSAKQLVIRPRCVKAKKNAIENVETV